jgi:signal transduction histidine kinase
MANSKNSTIRSQGKPAALSDQQLERIAHDFRAPLNIIIGFAELLLDETPGPINHEQKSSLTDILDSGHRLLDLVNRIFDPLARPEIANRVRPTKTAEIYYQR